MLQNEWIGLWSFASSIIFTWVLADQLPLLQTSWQVFAGKMLPQPAGGRKCFPRVCQILKHRFLCYRNKQIFIFGKTMLIAMVPILINKDVSEPSYNGFKIHCLKLQLISHRHHTNPGNKMWSSCHQGTQSIRKRQIHKQLIITYWAESNKADMMLAKALKYKLIVKLDIYKNINTYIKVWHLSFYIS